MTTETYALTPEPYERIQNFATIDYCDSLGGYDWDEFRVMRGVDGLLYVHAASGCSCLGFDFEDPADFTPVGGWQDAVKRLREWAREDDDWRRTVAQALEERLADKRPRKRIAIKDARNPWGTYTPRHANPQEQ